MPSAAEAAAATVVRRNNVTTLGREDGPVLLFAHGFGCDQGMFGRILPYFTDRYRVVLFDHVGSGRSDPAAYDPDVYGSLEGYAHDILEICDALDLTDVTLVAHSVGAMMAIAAAAERPERPERSGPLARLVLLAPSPSYIDDPETCYVGGFSREDIDELLTSLDSNYLVWAETLAPVVMANPDSPELTGELEQSFCRLDPAIARVFARVTFLSDVRPFLSSVRIPTLIVQCSQDLLAPPQVGEYLHAAMPNSSLVRLAATGHVPQVSAPAETANAVLRFLAGTP